MTKLLKAQKIRIYPTSEQSQIIDSTFGATRKLYNSLHAQFLEKSKLSEEEREKYTHKNYTALKNTWENTDDWLKNIAGQALAHAELDYKKSWSNYKKNPGHFNIPTFKSKHSAKKSYSISQNTVANHIRLDESNKKRLRIPKLGYVKLAQKIRYKSFTIKKITISKSSTEKYYISLLLEAEKPKNTPKTSKKVGLDLGLTHYLIDSEGNKTDNPRHLKAYQNKLAREQRKLSRRAEQAKKDGRKLSDSKNYQKQKLKVARIHEKIRNTRLDFIHKLSHKTVIENQVIVAESLNIKGMSQNKNLAKHILDASWSEFLRQLEYKSEWNDRSFLQVNRWFPSSKRCANCLVVSDKASDLSVREWVCDSCLTLHDRDVNAAKNILLEGLRQLV